MTYQRTTIAAAQDLAVSIHQAKEHLGLATSTQYLDEQVRGYIEAATAEAQALTGRQFINATYQYTFTRFPVRNRNLAHRRGERRWNPDAIVIPDAPAHTIGDITYIDSAGDQQTLTPKIIDGEPALLYPPTGEWWPETALNEPWTVSVTSQVGYGDDADSVPDVARVLICQIVDHLFHERAGEQRHFSANIRADPQVLRLAGVLSWGSEFIVWPP